MKKLQMRMNTNRVTANGTMRAPRGPMEVSTWFWVEVTTISQASWNLPGTPAVARLRTISPRAMVTMPAAIVDHNRSASIF